MLITTSSVVDPSCQLYRCGCLLPLQKKDHSPTKNSLVFPVRHVTEALVAWSPANVTVARALMQYNLAVAYSMRTEFQRALKALTEVNNHWHWMKFDIYLILISFYWQT